MLTILNENQLRQIFTCKRSPYFLFSVYVILPLSLLACLSYTYLSTSLLYFIYSSLSFFFFFIYPNFSFPLLLFVFSSWCFPLLSQKFLLKCSTGEEKKLICLWAVDEFQLVSFFFLTQKQSPYSVYHVSHLFLTILCPWHYYKMETTLSKNTKNLSFHFLVIFVHSLFTRAFIFPIGTARHYIFEGLFSFYVHIIQFSSSSSASLITLFRIFFWSLPYLSWLEPGHLLGFPGALVVKNPPANAGNIRDVGSIPG